MLYEPGVLADKSIAPVVVFNPKPAGVAEKVPPVVNPVPGLSVGLVPLAQTVATE